VFEELPRVRKELGQIPLVTPTSQIVGIQTVNNVLFDTPDERYKMITAQVRDLCYGLYGKTAAPIDPELQKKALKGYERGEEPITCRPAEVLKPELEAAKAEIKDLAVDEDDLILYSLFPVTGKKFLQQKYGKEPVPESAKAISMEDVIRETEFLKKAKAGKLFERKVNGEAPEKSECLRTFNVFVENECFEVGVDEVGGVPVIAYAQPAQAAAVQGTRVPPPPPVAAAPVSKAAKPAAPAAKAAASSGSGADVKAPMPGMIIKYEKSVGDVVKKGDTIVLLEAMKMENALPAPADGIIMALNFASGDSVSKGDVLAVIE